MRNSGTAQLEGGLGRIESQKQQLLALIVALLVVFYPAYSYGTDRPGSSSLGVIIGSGSSHPGWGDTSERVKTIDFAFRYESLPERVKGLRWYKNRRSFVLEVPLHVVRSPYDSFMFGVSFLSRWTFDRDGIKPYVLVGGGPVYSIATIRGMGAKINGSYQAGAGLEFTIDRRRYFVDVRYHHISNGGVREPNIPLNSSKILFGIEL